MNPITIINDSSALFITLSNIMNIKLREQLTCSSRKDRKGFKLWVTSNETKTFLVQSNPSETDAKGWKKLVLALPITKQMDHRTINIFVESQQLCYFDDFKFTIQKVSGNR